MKEAELALQRQAAEHAEAEVALETKVKRARAGTPPRHSARTPPLLCYALRSALRLSGLRAAGVAQPRKRNCKRSSMRKLQSWRR